MHRVMYDRVRNKEIYVEMTAFFNFEEEISNVGNSYENKNPDFPHSIGRKAEISK